MGNGNVSTASKEDASEHLTVDIETSGKNVDHYGGKEVCFSDVDELHAFL